MTKPVGALTPEEAHLLLKFTWEIMFNCTFFSSVFPLYKCYELTFRAIVLAIGRLCIRHGDGLMVQYHFKFLLFYLSKKKYYKYWWVGFQFLPNENHDMPKFLVINWFIAKELAHQYLWPKFWQVSRKFLNYIKEKMLPIIVWQSTKCTSTFFALTLVSLDFGKPIFWLTMILVRQELEDKPICSAKQILKLSFTLFGYLFGPLGTI